MSRVLIVEDEEHLATGLRFNLEAEGYDVEVVDNGESALGLLTATPGIAGKLGQLYDLYVGPANGALNGDTFPDDTPVKVFRRGTLSCSMTTRTCTFTLMLPDDVRTVD